jgi:hypothetical protein
VTEYTETVNKSMVRSIPKGCGIENRSNGCREGNVALKYTYVLLLTHPELPLTDQSNTIYAPGGRPTGLVSSFY